MGASQEEAEGIQRIPRQFHRIWLGGPMPDEFARFGQTWLEQHPGWTMRQWGDKYAAPSGPPIELVHAWCGKTTHVEMVCDECGERLTSRDVKAVVGPGRDAKALLHSKG